MTSRGDTLTTQGQYVDREVILRQVGQDIPWPQMLRNALILSRRELRDSFRDWRIITPIVLLTLVFPFLATVASSAFIRFFEGYGGDGEEILNAFLPLVPMVVGFFPASISLVIALESFVGEKERRSLEPLLATPFTNLELYIGKVIAASVPPLIAAYLGLIVYIGGAMLGPQQWRPDIEIIAQIVVLTTVQAVAMVTGAVVISSHTTSTRAANLLASVIILPISMLVIAESLIIIRPHQRGMLWYVALAVIIVTILLIRTGLRIFNREDMLARAVDDLNLGWIFSTFWHQFLSLEPEERQALQASGQRPNPLRWYRRAVWPLLGKIRHPALAVLIALVGGYIAGFVFAAQMDVAFGELQIGDQSMLENLSSSLDPFTRNPDAIIWYIFQRNIRTLAVAMFLAFFTFGVLAVLVVMVPFFVIGFLTAFAVQSGLPLHLVLLAVLPHGVIEIPAIFLVGVMGLRAGAIVTRPPENVTIGEAWLRAIADAVKVYLAVALPLLALAAVLEVMVTPLVLEWAIRTF